MKVLSSKAISIRFIKTSSFKSNKDIHFFHKKTLCFVVFGFLSCVSCKEKCTTNFYKQLCEKFCLKSSSSLVQNYFLFSPLHTGNMAINGNAQFPYLEKIGAFHENILIQNKKKTDLLLSKILRGTFEDLQFIVDFDYTLTRGHFNNEDSLCSWGILDKSNQMPPNYREESFKLLQKYHPIEIHEKMSTEEKIPYMVEWYTLINDMLKEAHLSRNTLTQMVSQANVKLRHKTDDMMKTLKENNVPTLIFSAGMGDILEHVLWHFNMYHNNVKVVSNFFKYDDNDVMIGFEGDVIHVFNKNENAIHSSDYFEKLKRRKNVVLMGDSIGDAKMADGVPDSSNVIKVGFYNYDKNSDRLKSYLDTYDIVLIQDQTMNLANAILNNINNS